MFTILIDLFRFLWQYTLRMYVLWTINKLINPRRYKVVLWMLHEYFQFPLEAVRMIDVVSVGPGNNVVLTVFHTLIERHSQAPILLESYHMQRGEAALIVADYSLQVFRQSSVLDKYDIIRLHSLREDAV